MKPPRVTKTIVMGDEATGETRAVLTALKVRGLPARICPTVYDAGAMLARHNTQVSLLIGPVRMLAQEEAFLVHWADATCVTCCGVFAWSAPLPEILLDCMAQARIVLCPIQKFSAWLAQYLIQVNSSGSLSHETLSEPLVSAAEQAALLEGWDDG